MKPQDQSMIPIHLQLSKSVQGSTFFDARVDMETPIVEVVRNLLVYVKTQAEKQGTQVEGLDNTRVTWSLQTVTGKTLNPVRTLSSENVFAGDHLKLVPQKHVEEFPALIDDQPEALAAYLYKLYSPWNALIAQKIAALMLPVVCAILGVVTIVFFWKHNHVSLLRYLWVGLLGFAAVCFITISMVGDKVNKTVNPRMTRAALQAGYCFLFPFTLLMLPKPLNGFSIVTMCACTLLVGVIIYQVTKTHRVDHSIVLGVCLVMFIVSCIRTLYYHGVVTLIGQVTTISLILLFCAELISRLFASITLSALPTAGEDFNVADNISIDITSAPLRGREAIENIINQDEKAMRQHQYYVGLNTGLLIMILAAGFGFGFTWGGTGHTTAVTVLTLTLPIAIYDWGRYYTNSHVQTVFVCAAALYYPLYTAGLLLGNHGYVKTDARVAVGVLISFVTVLTGCVIAFQEKKLQNPITKRVIEWSLTVTWLIPLIVLFILMDVYQMVRTLHMPF